MACFAWCSQLGALVVLQQSPLTGIAATVVDPTMFFRDTDQMVRQVSSLSACQDLYVCGRLCASGTVDGTHHMARFFRVQRGNCTTRAENGLPFNPGSIVQRICGSDMHAFGGTAMHHWNLPG